MRTLRLLVSFTAAIVITLSSVAAQPATPSTPGIELQPVVDGLKEPVGMADPGDGSGRLFVIERGGAIRIVKDGALVESPFLDLSDRVTTDGMEQGLLGLAFAPDYASSGFFYVNYSDANGDTVVARYAVTDDANVADLASEQIVLTQEQPYPNHNGGQLAFGPDGMLYIGLGDGGSQGDPNGNAQSLRTWLGKILRIDVNPKNAEAGKAYAVPKDNPHVKTTDALPEIWAMGLRNPWRFSFDQKTGDMWIADVGQNTIEEIDFVPKGMAGPLNFGWNAKEGSTCYEVDPCANDAFTDPALEYTHEVGGCSVTGGYVYRGAEFSSLDGVYLYADYCSGLIWMARVVDGKPTALGTPMETGLSVSSLGQDADGNVYVMDLGSGALLKVTARG